MSKKNSAAEALASDDIETVGENSVPAEPSAEEVAAKAVQDAIEAAFNSAVEAEKSEEEIKMDMIGAGAKFKNVTRIFNDLMVKTGRAMAKEDKDKVVSDVLEGRDLSTEEAFNQAVTDLTAKITNGTEKSSASLIRAYCKKKDIECFKKAPGTSGGTRTNFLPEYYNALIENPKMTEKEAHDFMEQHGTQNTLRWESTHQKVREAFNKLAAKYGI